jgi:YVTN family beta-propeller protein
MNRQFAKFLLGTLLVLFGVWPTAMLYGHGNHGLASANVWHFADPFEHHRQDSLFTREKLTDRVWVIYGRGGNIGVVITDESVLLIDTQFNDIAPGILEQVRAITDKPIRYVLNTHLHRDHVGGNPFFQKFADVVAHQNTYLHLLSNWEGEGIPARGDGLPQITFKEEMHFYLGGVHVVAFHLGRGHTDTDIVIWLPDEDVVHMGDLLFNEIIPYVDKPNGAHTEGWERFLRAVYQRIRPTTKVIPGHGKLTDREGIMKMLRYFRDMRQEVVRARKEGRTKEEILSMTVEKYRDWPGQRRLRMTLAALYTELFGNGPTLLVVNKSEGTLAFVDVETGDVRKKVRVGPNPHEVAVTRDGKMAFVSNYGSGRPAGRLSWLSVVDVERMRVVDEILLRHPETGKFLGAPHGLAVSADGRWLWVTAEGSQAVAQISIAERKVLRVYSTEQKVSHQVALLPDASKAYVANIGSGSVCAVDAKTGTVKVIPCAAGTEGIAVTPDGRWVWATNRSANSISIIDVQKDEVVATLPAGNFPIRIAFTPDGKYALVSNARDNAVAVYDVASRKQVRTISTGLAPIGLLVDPQGKFAYVANTEGDLVSVIDLEKWQVVRTIHTGDEPDGMAWSKVGG